MATVYAQFGDGSVVAESVDTYNAIMVVDSYWNAENVESVWVDATAEENQD